MHRSTISSLVSLPALLSLTAVFAACSSTGAPSAAGQNPAQGAGPSTTPGGGATGTGATTAAGGTGTDPVMMPGAGATMVPTGPAPTSTCGGAAVPEAFISTCSGCHTLQGAPNALFPDLYAFKGDINAFKMQVRMGGKIMAAYPDTVIADGDLEAAFKYFTSGATRASAVVPTLGGVVPLFNPADVVNPAIVTKRADGVNRHQGRGPRPWSSRKRGHVRLVRAPLLRRPHLRLHHRRLHAHRQAADSHHVPAAQPARAQRQPHHQLPHLEAARGQRHVRVHNYLPDATEADKPAEAGAAFTYKAVQQYNETMAPADRKFAVGENYEFEIGVFIDPAYAHHARCPRLVLHRLLSLQDRRGWPHAEQPRLRARNRALCPKRAAAVTRRSPGSWTSRTSAKPSDRWR